MAAAAMKQLTTILAMALFSLPIWWKVVESRHLIPTSAMSQRHNAWMAKYDRVYTTKKEKKKRFEIFTKNAKYVDELNGTGNKSYNVSIDNHFADHTEEEIEQRYYGYNSSLAQDPMFITSFRYEHVKNIPKNMDWRKRGVLTHIKNQEPYGAKCGMMSQEP